MTAIFAIFAYPRLQPGGAHCHIFAYYSSEYSYLSESCIKMCQHERNSSRFWSEICPKHPKLGFRGVRTQFMTRGGSRARARCAQRTHGREAAPLENFGPYDTGPRRIFAEGLGRSSLAWENQSWGGSRDQRITGRGLRGL